MMVAAAVESCAASLRGKCTTSSSPVTVGVPAGGGSAAAATVAAEPIGAMTPSRARSESLILIASPPDATLRPLEVRSPGSWVASKETLSPQAFPAHGTSGSALRRRPSYSGGTAPDLDRLPLASSELDG